MCSQSFASLSDSVTTAHTELSQASHGVENFLPTTTNDRFFLLWYERDYNKTVGVIELQAKSGVIRHVFIFDFQVVLPRLCLTLLVLGSWTASLT